MTSSSLGYHRLRRALVLAAAAPLMLWSAVAVAQTSTGAVRGYVTGPAGQPIAEAQVVARLAATNETRGSTTNAAGFYYLPGLRPGSYEITVRRIGFEPTGRVVLTPGRTDSNDYEYAVARPAPTKMPS